MRNSRTCTQGALDAICPLMRDKCTHIGHTMWNQYLSLFAQLFTTEFTLAKPLNNHPELLIKHSNSLRIITKPVQETAKKRELFVPIFSKKMKINGM